MKEKNTGLGISLEGTVRVVGGREVQARHYIRAIAPNGPVAKLRVHTVGDELLEVMIRFSKIKIYYIDRVEKWISGLIDYIYTCK